jgi:hypothetical protein
LVSANTIVEIQNGREPDPIPVVADACYRVVGEVKAIEVATVFSYDAVKDQLAAQPDGGISYLSLVQSMHAEAVQRVSGGTHSCRPPRVGNGGGLPRDFIRHYCLTCSKL